MRRFGFTMLELVFVIVVMGIIGKFGVEFLAQAYKSFIYSNINNSLQAESEMAVESIASRLQYRIKDSIIARQPGVKFEALSSSTLDTNATVLEWIGTDIEGFRGNKRPNWSGIIDISTSSAILLDSPETNTTAINDLIVILSHGSGTGINNSAIYFVGSNSDITKYGWNGVAFTDQSNVMHPIKSGAAINELIPRNATDGTTNSFAGVDVFEYYQLAWSAYAVALTNYNAATKSGDLRLYYDYQPWEGESYTDANASSALLMQNVSTFRFKAVGSVVKIQVCTKSSLLQNEEYSLCKEKTIF